MVPKGWVKVSLDQLAEVRTGVAKGKTGLKDPITVPYLRVANVQDGRIDLSEIKEIEIEREKLERYSLKYGDVLMNEGGDFDKLGRGDVWLNQIEPCLHQNHVFAVRPQQEKLNSFYLAALAASYYGKKYFLSCAKRSTNLASINSSQIKEFPVLVPPISEQQEIVQILSTWDKAILATEKLLENSQQQKKALMQQLLTGKKRLLDENGVRFSGVWKHIKLRSLIKEIKRDKEENPNNIELLTVKLHNKGAVASGKFPNSTEGGRPYYKRFAGELIIGRQNLHNGGVAIVPSECNGLIASNAISSFEALNDCDINFILSIMSTSHFRYLIDNLTGGTGQKEVSVRELLNVFVLIPCVEEQQKIAKVLTIADQEIETLQKKLDCLKQEKKALMQQLLTGKKRVKVAA